MIRFTEAELKDIKYVIATMALKAIPSEKIEGLFIGCQPLVKTHTQLVANDEEFVWLQKGENVYMLNLDHYLIHNTSVKNGNSVVQYSTTLQDVSTERFKIIQKVMADEKRVLATGLIDVSKYDLPEHIKKKLNVEEEAKTTTPKTHHTTNYSGGSAYKRKEPSTSVIKRTTKYPTTPAIARMQAKLDEIRDGKYQPPVLIKIPADDDKKEDVKKTAV